jgi:hypothetical protein
MTFSSGQLFINANQSQNQITLGKNSGNATNSAYLDLITDNGTSPGLRFFRNAGTNGTGQLVQQGSGDFSIECPNGNSILRLDSTKVIVESGHLTVGGTTSLNSTAGRIDATNDIVAYSTSDQRLKENIIPIDNALEKLKQISGVEFSWKPLTELEKKTIHGHSGNDIGIIAQEIEEVLPLAVTTRENGYKAVNYEKIVPLLVEAIKVQQSQIEKLQKGI